MRKHELAGKIFGRLHVIKEIRGYRQPNGAHLIKWKCRCICGKIVTIRTNLLVSGRQISCGCWLREKNRNQPKREKNPCWKGGKRIEGGYVLIYKPEHPKSKKNGYVREHTIVMEKKIGRPLDKNESVHHINGKKDDNRPSNLELWVSSQPPGQRAEDLVNWAKEILKKYGKKL